MESSASSSGKEEGLRLLRAGKIPEAIEVLKKAVAEDPDDPQVHCYLGAAFDKNHDKLHAIHEFEECLRLEESPKGYYNLGQIYESVHRVDEAIREYRMAVDLDPSYAQAVQALERLHAQYASAHPEAFPSEAETPAADEGPAATHGHADPANKGLLSSLFGRRRKD